MVCEASVLVFLGCYFWCIVMIQSSFTINIFKHMPLGRGLESLIPPKKQNSGTDSNTNLPSNKEEGNEPFPFSSESSRPEEIKTPEPEPAKDINFQTRSPIPPRTNTDVSNEIPEPPQKPKEKAKWGTDHLEQDRVFLIEVEKIKPNPYQPRREFNTEQLQELAQSIQEFGVLQPLVVTKVEKEVPSGTEVEYQLIAGERRLLASKLVGLERVPAIIKRVDTGRMKLELAIIENVQRSDLNPIEAGRAYARLQDEFGLTQREIALRVGKSREVIANTLRLLNLPSHIQEALSRGEIHESQARLLLTVGSIEKQQKMFENIVAQKMSVRKLKEKINPMKSPEELYWEQQLEEKLGAPVSIKNQSEGAGRLVIEFFSEEERKNIINKLIGNIEGEM